MKEEKPLRVSVITVCYNAAATIEQTILSVLAQTYPDIEYVVIDGGSTDGTLGIIEKYRDRLGYFVSEPDGGIYDAMNKGIARSTGGIVGILNADDWYEPGAVQDVVTAFGQENVELVYGKLILRNRDGSLNPRTEDVFKMESLEELFWGMMVPHPTVFVRRSVYERYGCFDTSYKSASDYELMLRFYTKGVSFFRLDRYITNFRTGGFSSAENVLSARETVRIADAYAHLAPDRELVKKENKVRLRRMWCDVAMRKDKIRSLGALFQMLQEDVKSIAIWGAGTWGRNMLEFFRGTGMSVPFFIDSKQASWGKTVDDVTVQEPDLLKIYRGAVFIAVKDHDDDIAIQLEAMQNKNLRWVKLHDFQDTVARIGMENAGTRPESPARVFGGGVTPCNTRGCFYILPDAASSFRRAA